MSPKKLIALGLVVILAFVVIGFGGTFVEQVDADEIMGQQLARHAARQKLARLQEGGGCGHASTMNNT